MDPETRAYLDEMRSEMRRRFDGADRRFLQLDQRFLQLDAELRRHFGVLAEQGRHELQTVAEMVVANTEAIAQLRQRLDAR